MEFEADATIDQICQSSIIEHAHVILVLEVLALKARHTIRHRLVRYGHQKINHRDGLG